MKKLSKTLASFTLLMAAGMAPAWSAETTARPPLTIDVPVVLKEVKIVFNMSHPAFLGDSSVGLNHMQLMVQNFKSQNTKYRMIAVFYGPMGYMLLGDEAYDKSRKSRNGNPYKDVIAELQKDGVEFEECAVTARGNDWINSDLLPGVKVNTGGNLRIVELVQEGFVQLQP
jgi:intracellular sulfur oxidation DsrE/DsrF family protein